MLCCSHYRSLMVQMLILAVIVFLIFSALQVHIHLLNRNRQKKESTYPNLQYLYFSPSTSLHFQNALDSLIVAKNVTPQYQFVLQTSEAKSNHTTETISKSHFEQDNLKSKEGSAVLQLRAALEELLSSLSTTTYHCQKMLEIGGYHCNHKPDGRKRMCQDPRLIPRGDYCLVYSLGVGHDLSFDTQQDKFGCDVYTFDSDADHDSYPTFFRKGVTFYKVRVGTEFVHETQYQAHNLTARPHVVRYWPLPSLMHKLGHYYSLLYYLKIDVEGAEWGILEQVLSQTNIMKRTQQLGVEIHFEELRHQGGDKEPVALIHVVNKYLRVVRGLQKQGFQLAHWEPNFRHPELTSVAGLTFHVFFETLWVNRNANARRNTPPLHPKPFTL